MAKYKFGKRSMDRLKGVHPTIVLAFEKALAHKDCPHDVGIPQLGGLRTVEDQQELFAQGRSVGRKKLPIVTWVDGINKKSNHQAKEDGFGYAVDVYIYEHETKSASWDITKLTEFARHLQKVAKEEVGIEISWGGDWERKDRPHFEYILGILPIVEIEVEAEPKEKEPAKEPVKKQATKRKAPAKKKATSKTTSRSTSRPKNSTSTRVRRKSTTANTNTKKK